MLYSSESEFDVKMIEKSKEFCILKKQQIDKQKKDIDDIICILDSLSSEYKELLGMYYLKGIKSKVCAEILGISLNTFATRKKEAIKMFESR